MPDKIKAESMAPAWFVGAMYGGNRDQLPRFLKEGIWENGYDDKLLDEVRSMRPGDRIAVKAAYTRKKGLPFDSRGSTVSVNQIRAIGTIQENLNDGRRVRVNWQKVDPPREWYFYTGRGTVWRVTPDNWKAKGLIEFTFDGKPQDIDRFRNDPFWRDRFGAPLVNELRFGWTRFYEAVAEKLLAFKNDRSGLVAGIRSIADRIDGLDYLAADEFADGTKGFVADICPFTTMGIFNRGVTETNRKAIAYELARFLGVDEPVPASFEGIPVLNNMKSWFFPKAKIRSAEHVSALWEVFEAALKLTVAEEGDDESQDRFARAFDAASALRSVGWTLSFGLYWAKPWNFLSLDQNSRTYMTQKLGLRVGRNGPKRRSSAADYCELMSVLGTRFQEPAYPVHSYPELSLAAWQYKSPDSEEDDEDTPAPDDEEDQVPVEVVLPTPTVPYSVENIISEGCFLERFEIERIVAQLDRRKNLILQGPPGTGKTWLARRLAFAHMQEKDESRVRVVQFHPNLSYEDFVRGWRPTGDGRLSLVDGVFMETIKAASRNATAKYFVVIEEINRGNPAQIFGELLTLLECGKRTPNDALELTYPDTDGKRNRVHIPDNVYVIGTMNIADRSLALVDLALRRRFCFISLEPRLGEKWRNWVVQECGIDVASARDIESRINSLNDHIASDPRLGKQFRIGHSYVTPSAPLEAGSARNWFREVVDTEIGPLLDEYWFDAPAEAQEARDRLLQAW